MTLKERLRKLPHSAIASVRKKFAVAQKYRCPLCEGTLAGATPSLDHCHKTGHVRATLCQSCNVGEGKVGAAILFRTPKTNLAYRDPVAWLRNLADYLEYHQQNPSGLIHPTFDIRAGKQQPVKRRRKKK